MVVRSFGQVSLIALLVSCSADIPESSSSTASDSARDRGSAVPQPDPVDTARPQPPDNVQPSSGVITPDGWGPLRIGMSRAEVVAAAGEDANPEAVGGPDPERCDEFRPRDAPDGVLVMLERGVLTRISVSGSADIATPAGFRVGDRAADVLDEHGASARVEPHQYWESPAQYITVWRPAASEEERRGIRYEIDSDGRIVHLRAGGASIEYVEGCV